MFIVPAICNNPKCNTIFPSGFAVGAASGNQIVDCLSGPCLVCGGQGRVPSGEYESVAHKLSAKLQNISDVQLLKSIQSKVHRALEQENAEDVAKELEKDEPSWQEIWRLIPENRADAFAFLQLILSFIATAVAIYSVTSRPAEQTTIINQSFEHYYYLEPPLNNQNEIGPFRVKPLTQAIRRTRI